MTSPWHLVVIEILMQGCTYALCYTCIVGEWTIDFNLKI
jgi:hypothetical protein